MTVEKLTARTLLGAPRRGAPLPNASGTLALYTLSTHDFRGDGKTAKEVRVMDLSTGESKQLSDSDKVSDATWVPGSDEDVVYIKSGEKGKVEVFAANAADVAKEHYVVASIDAPIGSLKLRALRDGAVAFVVTGSVGGDGALHNDEKVEKKSTGQIFDTAKIHFWDKRVSAQRTSLWYTEMVKDSDKWTLATSLHNAILDDKHHLNAADDGADDVADSFDVSKRGIAFLVTDRTSRTTVDALKTKSFYLPLDFRSPPSQKPREMVRPQGVEEGMGLNIRISVDASTIAHLYVEEGDFYGTHLCLAKADSPSETVDALKHFGVDFSGQEPMAGFAFGESSDSIIFTSPYHGRVILSRLTLQKGEKPRLLLNDATITAYVPLKADKWDGDLLVGNNSYVENSCWRLIRGTDGEPVRVVSSASDRGAKFGLSPAMVSEVWFKGDDDIDLQSWEVRPSDFDVKKKYPWILFPHGGPVASHNNAWSTRWNMAAWAEQGYICFMPNITGSPGFGEDVVERIRGSWGGHPVQDLLNLIEHLEKVPYLDQDKAVLAGASYSGYLVSWFLGDDIMKKFCGAVWHDGIYDLAVATMQDDFYFTDGSKRGPVYPWEQPEELQKWNPARPDRLRNWKHAPPTLVVHSDNDYRCNVADGIAMVKALHAQGVPTRFLNFTDEGHWVLKPENSLVWHNTVWDWVKRCVEGSLKRGDKTW